MRQRHVIVGRVIIGSSTSCVTRAPVRKTVRRRAHGRGRSQSRGSVAWCAGLPLAPLGCGGNMLKTYLIILIGVGLAFGLGEVTAIIVN